MAMVNATATGRGVADSEAERRCSPRYPPVNARAWMGWQDHRGFQCAPCWILDLATGGIRLGLVEVPPPGEPLILRLDGSLLPCWFEATLLEIEEKKDHFSFRSARLTFPDGCPYELFMAVIYGRVNQDDVHLQRALPEFLARISTERVRGSNQTTRDWVRTRFREP